MTARCVLAGILALGRVGYEAFDAGERSLGVFGTQNGAINKIQATMNEGT